jgi:hypothetical protein
VRALNMARSENRSTDYPVVVAHVADWPQGAAVLIATLRDHLRILAERIEHIGMPRSAAWTPKTFSIFRSAWPTCA